jgi:hypothetical protein
LQDKLRQATASAEAAETRAADSLLLNLPQQISSWSAC